MAELPGVGTDAAADLAARGVASTPPAPVGEGSRINEYLLVRALHCEAGGRTFVAYDELLSRPVTLRFLDSTAGGDARAEGVRLLARVSHPALARVHRVCDDHDPPYLVTDFVRGHPLDQQPAPLPAGRVLELGAALAGALAALHAEGVVHGDVRPGTVILDQDGAARLIGIHAARPISVAPEAAADDVAALVRLLRPLGGGELGRLADLPDAALPAAADLRAELMELAHPRPESAAPPYLGLRTYSADDRPWFFGRDREIAELLERLRGEPWLVIAGRSAAGKSSLARAGLAPAIAEGALGERPAWDVAIMVPGTHPLRALSAALAPFLDLPADLRLRPAAAAHAAAARTDRGLLLLIDQLEEILTIGEAGERAAFLEVLSQFSTLSPGVCVVMTARSDFLGRLAELPMIGPEIVRAAALLGPMTTEGLRDAIIEPARSRGVRFATPAMVDALVREASGQAGLPLLSFLLAELWESRDLDHGVIPESALSREGATAALARHGDRVLAALTAAGRREARRILCALVAADGTRVHRARDELTGSLAAEAALEALVAGRLVVAGETYEIAHEALATAWPRLRAWLDEASVARGVARRLEVAADDWQRAGRNTAGLWQTQRLADLEIPGALAHATPADLAFVAASRRAVQRARRRKIVVAVGIPLALLCVAGSVWATAMLRRQSELDAIVSEARSAVERSRAAGDEVRELRRQAFAAFEQTDLGPAEILWKRALARDEEAEALRREASAIAQRAVAIDPTAAAARAVAGDIALDRILAAEAALSRRSMLPALRSRLALYDDGSRQALLSQPGQLTVASDPPGARLVLHRYVEDAAHHLVESDGTPLEAGLPSPLEPGSYVITAEQSGRYPTRYPLLLRGGDALRLTVVLPPAAAVPPDFVYVPAGRFLYGSDEDEPVRGTLTHQPIHEVEVPAFLVGRTEVTYGEYLEYVRAEPTARLPLRLSVGPDGRASVKLADTVVAEGEKWCPPARGCVDWSRLPIANMTRPDGEAYAAWLARRVPGARLCTDHEWEKAARGADGRRFPGGNAIPSSGEACTLFSFGHGLNLAWSCEVATHPASRSPYGVDDLTGNVWEWTSDSADRAKPGEAIARGGSWADDSLPLRIDNRGINVPTLVTRAHGLRLCANAPADATGAR